MKKITQKDAPLTPRESLMPPPAPIAQREAFVNISVSNIIELSKMSNEVKAYLQKQFPDVFWKEGDYLISIHSNSTLYKFSKIGNNDDEVVCSRSIYKMQDGSLIVENKEFILWSFYVRLATEEEIKRFIPDYVKQDETPLEKAKRLYKKGTKFKSLSDERVVHEIEIEPYFEDMGDDGICLSNHIITPCVMLYGVWAEIVEM